MVVTGSTTSRLSELKKYKVTEVFTEKYFGDGSLSKNGVDFNNSTENDVIVYYINKIKYTDTFIDNDIITTFEFTPTTPETVDGNLIKLTIGNVFTQSKTDSDVFIERQRLSIFRKNQELGSITCLYDLLSYGGGRYFNIIKNT